jgi:hypothetical protein
MSHTVPFGEAERERQTENRFNAVIRHCRIGKVKLKAAYPRHPFDLLPPYKTVKPFIWQPNTADPAPIAWWQNPVVSTCATGHTH